MVTYAPSTWSLPASTPLTGANDVGRETRFLIDTWISPSLNTSTGVMSIRYLRADDPSGSWGTASALPALTGGYAFDTTTDHLCATDGTNYVVTSNITAGGTAKTAIFYTTDPTGSWSLGTADHYTYDFTYGNGYWVRAGEKIVPGTRDAMLSYTTSITGTWTTDLRGAPATSSAYDALAYANGTWVRHYSKIGGGSPWALEYSSSPGGTWSTAGTGTSQGCNGIRYLNGYWVMLYKPVSSAAKVLFTTDITAGTYGTTTCGLSGTSANVYDLTWDGTYWAAATLDFTSYYIKYHSGTSPDDTWNTASGYSSATGTIRSIQAAKGWMVASRTANGQIRYAFTNSQWPPPATGSTYLRRRQSPAYTPSRVRPPQLRQRQRPEVT